MTELRKKLVKTLKSKAPLAWGQIGFLWLGGVLLAIPPFYVGVQVLSEARHEWIMLHYTDEVRSREVWHWPTDEERRRYAEPQGIKPSVVLGRALLGLVLLAFTAAILIWLVWRGYHAAARPLASPTGRDRSTTRLGPPDQ